MAQKLTPLLHIHPKHVWPCIHTYTHMYIHGNTYTNTHIHTDMCTHRNTYTIQIEFE